MKKLILNTLFFIIAANAISQTPQALNYQAIARNSVGQIVPSQPIGVRFTVLDATGNTTYYQETHTTTTNNFGLFTLAIGKGTAVSGTIPAIDWSAGGDKYLKVEIAPQGGTNYTIQGTTQLLSVPYALYAEKTKLISGNAITITNGNTINANYVAGTGINITGNVISTTGNPWLLNGNAGTTASNFLGSTDNLPLNIRTNNLQRLSISESNIVGTNNISYILAGQQSNFSTNPVQLSVYGKDISGFMLPFGIAGSVAGMNWSSNGGSNNTLGRLIRLSQFTNTSGNNYQFFDVGIDQGGDYFVGEHQLWSDGPVTPKKMITISPQDFVGVNFNWGENPTANFHTKGTLRFEGVNTNNTLTRILAMDASGNVASRDGSTLLQWAPDANGINYSLGNVGVGANSNTNAVFNVMGNSSFPYTAEINSTFTWQTSLNLFNSTSIFKWYMVTGGSANTQTTYGVGTGNFGIAKENTSSPGTTFPIIIASDDKVGIGMGLGGTNNVPRTQLHVKTGDIYIEQIGSGVIMKSPNGQCWRMTVSDAGTPVFTAISCP
jgi:hypothetical protein